MSQQYEPELGQMIFGQPTKEFKCAPILDAALEYIRHELSRVTWNLKQEQLADPFGNTGGSFRCANFAVCAYSWSDEDDQPWNFKHFPTGLEVSWYKYAGRGMSVNREVGPDDVSALLIDCLNALAKVEKGELPYDEPGLYPEGTKAEAA